MCPHWAQRRRWNHQPPTSSHSAQPVPLGGTVASIGSAVTGTPLFPFCRFRMRLAASGIASGTHTRKPGPLGKALLQARSRGSGRDRPHSASPMVATMAALMVCSRFSAWANTIEAGDSKTSSVTSSAASPRLS